MQSRIAQGQLYLLTTWVSEKHDKLSPSQINAVAEFLLSALRLSESLGEQSFNDLAKALYQSSDPVHRSLSSASGSQQPSLGG